MTQQRSDWPEYSAADRLMAMLAKAFDQSNTPYVVIGGQAVVQHGYSRATLDVDVSLAISTDGIRPIINLLDGLGFEARFAQDETTLAVSQAYFAIHRGIGIEADFTFVDAPYLNVAIQRADVHTIEGYPVRFLCLEDLLIHKVLASRKQDLADVEQLLILNNKIDHDEVEHWLASFEPLVEADLVKNYRDLRRGLERSGDA
ncbi:MAG: DUF6036 family nucleotidyltransferase [Phycisphaeraceae bacterium]